MDVVDRIELLILGLHWKLLRRMSPRSEGQLVVLHSLGVFAERAPLSLLMLASGGVFDGEDR